MNIDLNMILLALSVLEKGFASFNKIMDTNEMTELERAELKRQMLATESKWAKALANLEATEKVADNGN